MQHRLTAQFILDRLAQGETAGSFDAACLFVDISGFTPLTVSRLSRILSVREGPTARPVAPPRPLEQLTPAEQEKIREQFLERFIKRLP